MPAMPPRHVVALLLLVLIPVACAPSPQPRGGEALLAPRPTDAFDPAAESVVRATTEAILMKDRATIELHCLPEPGLDLLWSGREPRPFEVSRIMEELDRMQVRAARSDEWVATDEGRLRGDGSSSLLLFARPPGAASEIPFLMIFDGRAWRVDPRPMIAARRR